MCLLMGSYSLIAWTSRGLDLGNLNPMWFQVYEIFGLSRRHTQHLQGTRRYTPYPRPGKILHDRIKAQFNLHALFVPV